jgi:hypothetical protein
MVMFWLAVADRGSVVLAGHMRTAAYVGSGVLMVNACHSVLPGKGAKHYQQAR